MSKRTKKEIGKGLRALLSNIDQEEVQDKQGLIGKLSSQVAAISLVNIEVNPFQPRMDFDQEALEALSESIKVHGLIQPITVRRLDNDNYQLISGERRLRAAKMAGVEEIPAFIRLANDQEMLEMALVENIQREDLNSIEVAITFKRLMDECTLTHEQLSTRVGKNRSTVTNYLRLLKLPPEIQLAVKDRKLSMGHARALSGLPDLLLQLSLFKEVVRKELSVRQTEELVRKYAEPSRKKKATPGKLEPEYRKVQDDLSSHLGTKVALKVAGTGKGQIVINFMDTDDLNRILEMLEDN